MYTDDELRVLAKITVKIAADYLSISPMMVTLGMTSNRLRHQKENRCSESRSYNIILERLIAYHHGKNACRIHAYVSAMEKAYSEQALSAWASWARAKADWYDPAIAKKKTNFLAGGSMKRIKRTKDPGTTDTGGKAKGYLPSESNNIVVHLSISLSNYSKYNINNS